MGPFRLFYNRPPIQRKLPHRRLRYVCVPHPRNPRLYPLCRGAPLNRARVFCLYRLEPKAAVWLKADRHIGRKNKKAGGSPEEAYCTVSCVEGGIIYPSHDHSGFLLHPPRNARPILPLCTLHTSRSEPGLHLGPCNIHTFYGPGHGWVSKASCHRKGHKDLCCLCHLSV